MAVDPKAQAQAAQEAAAVAKVAAKAAAVAAAKAEAKAEAEAGSSGDSGGTPPLSVNVAGLAATGAAASVPLDVFTQPKTTLVARDEERSNDLNADERRMADASGAGRAGALDPGKPGVAADPDFSSVSRPGGGTTSTSPFDTDSPLADRASAFRDDPLSTADNPVDGFGEIEDRGESLRTAAGWGGGLDAMAQRLHSGSPGARHNPGIGKGMISDAPADPALAAALEEAAKIPTSTLNPDAGVPDAGPGSGTPDAGTPSGKGSAWNEVENEVNNAPTPEPSMWDKFLKVFQREVTADGVTPTGEAMRQVVEEIDSLAPPASPPDAGTPDAGADAGGVTDPGPEGAENTPLPPGFIGGDLLLPPALRTGAAVGGAKGNDGVDWANQRWGASNPSPEATGGGGKLTYIEREGKQSLISQPEHDDDPDGEGMNGVTGTGSLGKVSDLDYDGRTFTEDEGDVRLTSNDGALAHLAPGVNDDDDDGGRGD